MKRLLVLPCLALVLLAGCATVPDRREAAALAVLKSDAGLREKARACQQLADFAGPAAVPALASLLSHEQLSDYARSGLESMADPAAGAALRAALPSLRGRQLAGAINSLGVRRDTQAVKDLQGLAGGGTGTEIPAAATAALGLIATPEAADALRGLLTRGPAGLREATAHAALAAAERLAAEGRAALATALLQSVLEAVPQGPAADAARRQLALLRAA